MSALLKVFFAPIQPIVFHPERAFFLAGLFAILFAVSLVRMRRFNLRRHLILLFAVLAWALFGLHEGLAMSNGWNIRIDLFISWPLMLVVSIVAAWTGLRSLAPRTSDVQNAKKSANESPRDADRPR
jgi:hypothetical protein